MLPSFSEVKRELLPALQAMEQSRHLIRGNYAKRLWLLAGTVLLSLVPLLTGSGWLLVIPAIIGVSIYIWFYRSHSRETYRLQYKKSIVAELAASMASQSNLPRATDDSAFNCNYCAKQHTDIDIIKRSKLVPEDAFVEKGEDLFRGRMGGTDFEFSELKISVEVTDSEHSTKSNYPVFKGICFIADIHKEFQGHTILHTHNAASRGKMGKKVRNLLYKVPPIGMGVNKEITFDDHTFNETFLVRTSDEQEARYLLSPTLLSRLVQFRYKHKGRIEISFYESRIYVLMSSRDHYFEASLGKEADGEQLHHMYDDLAFFFGILEDLDMNSSFSRIS